MTLTRPHLVPRDYAKRSAEFLSRQAKEMRFSDHIDAGLKTAATYTNYLRTTGGKPAGHDEALMNPKSRLRLQSEQQLSARPEALNLEYVPHPGSQGKAFPAESCCSRLYDDLKSLEPVLPQGKFATEDRFKSSATVRVN